MKWNEEKFMHYLRQAIWVLAALALMIMVAVGIKYTYNNRYLKKIAELEEVIKSQRSSMNIESLRQFNIARISAIIAQYNRIMPNPQKYDIARDIYDASLQYTNLDIHLVCAIITYETNGTWNPEFISKEGAMGLLQIMPITGMYIARTMNLNWVTPDEVLLNPLHNVRIGTRYLAALIDAYGVDGALAARRVGEWRAASWSKSGKANDVLPADAREYMEEILTLYEKLKQFKG
jgi:soluble lytic murein transglycosylase-like protein